MCTDCNNQVSGGDIHIGFNQQAYCEQCGGDNNCVDTLDAKCVIFKDSCRDSIGLPNLEIPCNTSLEVILQKIDYILGNAYNTPLIAQDSETIIFSQGGIAGHTFTGVVKLSDDPDNTLSVKVDGLFGAESGKVKVNAEDELDYLVNQIEPGDDPLGIVSLEIEAVDGRIRITPTIDISALCAALQSEGCLCAAPENLNI